MGLCGNSCRKWMSMVVDTCVGVYERISEGVCPQMHMFPGYMLLSTKAVKSDVLIGQ